MNRKPKKPKNTLLKKTSSAADAAQMLPIVAEFASNYAYPAISALGIGTLAHVRRKLKKIDKEYGGSK
jgi:hypothetical protein